MALESVELDGFWPRDRDGINAFLEDNVMASTLLNFGVNHASLPTGIHASIPDEMKNLAEEIARLSEELEEDFDFQGIFLGGCLLYTSPSPRDLSTSRMPSSA